MASCSTGCAAARARRATAAARTSTCSTRWSRRSSSSSCSSRCAAGSRPASTAGCCASAPSCAAGSTWSAANSPAWSTSPTWSSASPPRSRSRAGSPTRRSTCSTPTAPASTALPSSARFPPERLDASAERALLDRVRGGYVDKDQLGHELDDVTAASQTDGRRTPLLALTNRLDELYAGVIFPLLGSAETEQGPWLLGLFCVRDDRTESAFDSDDLD